MSTPLRRVGERSYSAIILDLGTGWGEWSASRPGRLSSGKEPPVPIEQEAVWAPEPVWTFQREEKFLAPTGNRRARGSVVG
jgi:hypothetical protein